MKTYSGGMIRRLELAQAMLHRPAILFLDEPTIGLDPMARHSVWDRLRDLRRDYGMTVLITTHDMEEAEALCDELAILHAGQVGVVGKPAELRAGLGAGATMDDVFAHYAGGGIQRERQFPRRRPDPQDRSAPGLRTIRWTDSCARAPPSREVELIKLLRDPTEMFSRAVQPVLWLVVFGQVLAQVHGIHTGAVGYLAFITPGILAQSVLFSAIFYGIAVIWERDLGVVHKLLVSPARRDLAGVRQGGLRRIPRPGAGGRHLPHRARHARHAAPGAAGDPAACSPA